MLVKSKFLVALALAAAVSVGLSGCSISVPTSRTEVKIEEDDSTREADRARAKEAQAEILFRMEEEKDLRLKQGTRPNAPESSDPRGEPDVPKEADEKIDAFLGDYSVHSTFFSGDQTDAIFRFSPGTANVVYMTAHDFSGYQEQGVWDCTFSIVGTQADMICHGYDTDTRLELFFVKYGPGQVTMVGQGYDSLQGGHAFGEYKGDKR